MKPSETSSALIREVHHAGRAAWPDVALDAAPFERHLERHRAGVELAGWLAQARVTDLYLACACVEGVPGAIAAFERVYMPLVDEWLRRGAQTAEARDEVRQRLRERLLVGARKLGDYSGRGTLAKWLEVVTLRLVVDVARERKDVLADDSGSLGGATPDPEIEFIKERYRVQFKQALQRGIASLEVEQRTLLKLHFIDGVTLDQLAELFHVHRATVARRIAGARERILDAAKALLERELGVPPEEVERELRLVRSRIDLSLSALLGRATSSTRDRSG
jgi:RNA polymerase sigma-70 factor (ECF subfamily)